jgi:copper(I)-binding protein
MATYVEHITQVSVDGDWRLEFDATITTPEEAFSVDENKSTIDRLDNPVMTFIEEKTNENIYGGSAKLSGKCMNYYWLDGIFVKGVGVSNPFGTNQQEFIHTGETVNDHPTLKHYMLHGFSGNYGNIVPHDADGNGEALFRYKITLTEGSKYNTHNEIEFLAPIPLRRINIHGIPFTEMGANTKEAIINGDVAIRTRLVINNPEQNMNTVMALDVDNETSVPNKTVLTESDAIKTWELNDERYVPNDGFIGQFVSRTLTGELHNIDDDFSIENKDVELQIGVVHLGTRYTWLTTEDGDILIDEMGNRIYLKDLGNDMTTWYSLGNFLITKPEDDEVKDNTKFEAFDYAVKFNADFNADYTNTTYQTSFNELLKSQSVTAKWLADYTCAQVGVELATNNFTNGDFQITSNQFVGGESCRDVMKAISELSFGWCRIGWDNKCYIDEIQTISTTSGDENILTNDNYYSLTTQKEIYGPVNRVVVGMSAVDGEDVSEEDLSSIEQYGLTEITIMDNPLLYTEELRQSIVSTGMKLFGLHYTPLETETPGHPWLKGYELLDVKDMEGASRPTYAFNKTMTYNGHIKTKLSSPAPTEQEKTMAYNKTIYKTLRDVGIKVDKQAGLITETNAKVLATEDGLHKLETRYEREVTDTYTKTQIKEIISGVAEDGTVVSSVKTIAGTFDMNGLTIERNDANTKTNINTNGMIIYNTSGTSKTDELLNVNSDGIDAKNIKVNKYLNIGSHSRLEDYEDGTGVFYIGGGF